MPLVELVVSMYECVYLFFFSLFIALAAVLFLKIALSTQILQYILLVWTLTYVCICGSQWCAWVCAACACVMVDEKYEKERKCLRIKKKRISLSRIRQTKISFERERMCVVCRCSRSRSLSYSRPGKHQINQVFGCVCMQLLYLQPFFFRLVFSVSASLLKTILSVCIYIDRERERETRYYTYTDKSNKVRMHVNSVGWWPWVSPHIALAWLGVILCLFTTITCNELPIFNEWFEFFCSSFLPSFR